MSDQSQGPQIMLGETIEGAVAPPGILMAVWIDKHGTFNASFTFPEKLQIQIIDIEHALKIQDTLTVMIEFLKNVVDGLQDPAIQRDPLALRRKQ